MNEIIQQNILNSLRETRHHNTMMLKEIPTLKDYMFLQLGNFLFIPKREENKNEKYTHFKVMVDNQEFVFFTPEKNPCASMKLYDAKIFDLEGINIIFNNNIPIEFKQTVLYAALSQNDMSYLPICFEKDEIEKISNSDSIILNLENHCEQQ